MCDAKVVVEKACKVGVGFVVTEQLLAVPVWVVLCQPKEVIVVQANAGAE